MLMLSLSLLVSHSIPIQYDLLRLLLFERRYMVGRSNRQDNPHIPCMRYM